jgi:signal transduction histidine kinase
VVNGQKIGILRCVNDYTSVYEQSDTNMRLINIIILGGFLLCLLFGVVLSSSVITPIRRLRSNLKSVAGGINGGDLETSAVSYKLNLKRRDEIGDLARVTVDLIEKISLQINVINKDREELSRLSEYRRDFYNIVTHELKTPLTSIKGYAEVARSNGFSDPDFFDMAMSRIMEESDRLHNMVVTLLEESRLNKTVDMPLERVDLRETAESVCDSMQYKAQKYDRTLNLNAADACWVLGDPQGLRELIINLLDNAIKYASDSLIEIKISGDDRYVRLEVLNPVPFGTDEWDGGFMLPPGDSAKHEKGSVGLGIGICRQIAEKHNGTIRYSLSDDDILNVTVTLPAYRGL